jgi:GNAT superfamily N-acetyltransferase
MRKPQPLTFRKFTREDAEFCFRVRIAAFVVKFYGELSPEEVAAGVNCYQPADYARMAARHPVFVCEHDGKRLGFFALKRHDRSTAELPLLYLDLQHAREGIGGAAVRYAERWIQKNWKEVTTLFVDTVIPKYNGGFYRAAGFAPQGETSCSFHGLEVKALRFTKTIAKRR